MLWLDHPLECLLPTKVRLVKAVVLEKTLESPLDCKEIQHETGGSGLVQWDDPGGWDGVGGRRGFLDGEHMCARG